MTSIKDFLRKTLLWIVLLPWAIFGLGLTSNQLVFLANHDKFPVAMNPERLLKTPPDAYGMLDSVHCVMTSDTHLNILADWIDFQSETDSPGDLLQEFALQHASQCWLIWLTLIAKKLYELA